MAEIYQKLNFSIKFLLLCSRWNIKGHSNQNSLAQIENHFQYGLIYIKAELVLPLKGANFFSVKLELMTSVLGRLYRQISRQRNATKKLDVENFAPSNHIHLDSWIWTYQHEKVLILGYQRFLSMNGKERFKITFH